MAFQQPRLDPYLAQCRTSIARLERRMRSFESGSPSSELADDLVSVLADLRTAPIGSLLEHVEAIADAGASLVSDLGDDTGGLGADALDQLSEWAEGALGMLSAAEREAADRHRANIGVPVEQLDQLVALAGELVLARNQILQSSACSGDPAALATAHRLNLITTEMQERIMKVRMQPIGMLWERLPEMVSALADSLGRDVHFELDGKETELDKTLLEAVEDPLAQIVRHAIEQRLESPADRNAAGKPSAASLFLRAYHESGQVIIEIIDDGCGVDTSSLRQRAIDRGVLTAEEAHALNDRQVQVLMFHPELAMDSDEAGVRLSGSRLDTVRPGIEKIGGTLEVEGTSGQGTTVRVSIPLTLAIVPALMVRAGSDRYAIPQVSLVELVRLDSHGNGPGIERLHGSPTYRLRGELLPLVVLQQQLGLPDPSEDGPCCIVVVRAAGIQFGLVVDEIDDTEEIVVKPLDRHTKSVPIYAGTTILGDGQVALILDIVALARDGRVVDDEREEVTIASVSENVGASDDAMSFLLVAGRDGTRVAIDLESVDRLEEIPRSAFESTREGDVLQYRGEIMKMIDVDELICRDGAGECPDPGDDVQVVVVERESGYFGLVVRSIEDIVDVVDPMRRPSDVEHVSAVSVINGRVTAELDLESILERESGMPVGGEESIQEDTSLEPNRTRQFCTFHVDGHFFGVDVMHVQEVLRGQAMTRVPRTDHIVRGLINLRGQTVTALDMRRRLGRQDAWPSLDGVPEEDHPLNVVLRTDDGIVSILVDSIGDVLTIGPEVATGRVPGSLGPSLQPLLETVYLLEDVLLVILDANALVSTGDATTAPVVAIH